MNTSELMLGDYVAVLPGHMPIQIAGLTEIQVAYKAAETHELEWVDIKWVEPIEITEKFLEKNEIHRKEYYAGRYFEFDYCLGDITFNLGLEECGIYTDSGDYVYFGECKYVHQLQHILKLKEIDKEIKP